MNEAQFPEARLIEATALCNRQGQGDPTIAGVRAHSPHPA
jgi:hypothetical protein